MQVVQGAWAKHDMGWRAAKNAAHKGNKGN
jgi:hypothetical protein